LLPPNLRIAVAASTITGWAARFNTQQFQKKNLLTNEAFMRILLAEDDEATRTLLGEWLEMQGHQALLAKDGLEGILMFNGHKPDIVITDCLMPQVSGKTLTQHVKCQSQDTPVIMLTGFSERFTRAEAERIGANEYLQKPVVLERLKQILDIHDRYYAPDPAPSS
jgi:DNA-binding response OmpR family regulator